MKPKSKKEQYTVECKNVKQTISVLNYIDEDNDQEWSYWKYVTRCGNNDSDINDSINESIKQYPIISFEEWDSLPDEEFVLPENWCINGCEKLSIYFNKFGVNNLSGNYDNQFYYIADDGNWDCDTHKNDMTLITFEQFKEHVLGEKEIETKTKPFESIQRSIETWKKFSDMSSNIKIEENNEISGSLTETKKVIGYKLIKQEYIKSCNIIVGINDESDFYVRDLASPKSIAKEKLSKAGVLDLWFEPVYQSSTEQKIIDFVNLIKSTQITHEQASHIVKLVNEK